MDRKSKSGFAISIYECLVDCLAVSKPRQFYVEQKANLSHSERYTEL